MKYSILVILSVLSLVPGGTQDKTKCVTLQSCMVSEPLYIQTPVLSDSVNIFGGRYDIKQILKTGVAPGAFKQRIGLLSADPATGYFSIDRSATDKTAFYIFNFTVTASGFTKARLKITSPHALEVYVEAKKVAEKLSLQKSPDKSLSTEWAWKLEPRSYGVAVKYLHQAGDSLKPAIKIVLEPDQPADLPKLQVAPGQTTKRPVTMYDILEGERPSTASISPDGKYVLLRSTVVLPEGKKSVNVKIMHASTGKLVLNTQNDQGWQWMPRGSRLYSVSAGAQGRKLMALDVSSLQESILVEGLPEGNFTWAPDERYLLFSITDKAPGSKDSGVHRILTPMDRQAGWRDRSFLYQYHLDTGVLQPLLFGYRTTSLLAVSPDAQSIVFSTERDHYTERPFSLYTVCRLHLNNMQVDTLWHDIKYGSVICFSPDGTRLLLYGGPESFDGIGRDRNVAGIPNDYDTQAFIYHFSDKRIQPITLNFNPCIQSAFWSKNDNDIYFTASDADYVRCYRYQTKKEKFEQINVPVDVLQNISLADDVPVGVGLGQSDSYASIVFRIDLRNNKTTVLADPMKPVMDQLHLGKVQDWNFRSTGGSDIRGRAYYPYNFDENKKYPLIVYYYGGTTPVERTFDGRYPFHLYAAMGYVVYVMQPSGTVGFGQAFSARHVNAWGEYTADEIIEGTKKFCDDHPFINREKTGCIGASYGGFMTMYLQTRTDIFAAAVSHAGISDITSYWGEGYWGYSYNAAAAAGSYPWNNQGLFVGHSPLFAADKVKTPLLLLHGDSDTNVPPGESIQMFTALKILGKPVELITVEGENHHILNYHKRIRWNNTIFAWFAKWLQNDDSWWNELYPETNY